MKVTPFDIYLHYLETIFNMQTSVFRGGKSVPAVHIEMSVVSFPQRRWISHSEKFNVKPVLPPLPKGRSNLVEQNNFKKIRLLFSIMLYSHIILLLGYHLIPINSLHGL